jgi:hypothetical protein
MILVPDVIGLYVPPLVCSSPLALTLTLLCLVLLQSFIILFGGIIAPTLQLKLGLGGQSYKDFIESVHLPSQVRKGGAGLCFLLLNVLDVFLICLSVHDYNI